MRNRGVNTIARRFITGVKSVGWISKNFVERIGRFLSRVDDANEGALIIKDFHNFIQYAVRAKPAHVANERWGRGSLDVHKK